MYGLPKDFNGQFLVGCKLEMVSFTATQVYLNFDNRIMITIEAGFSHRHTRNELEAEIISMPVLQSDLMQLLEFSISEVFWNEKGTITMIFENNHVLECVDSYPNYESYQIKHGEKVIVV